MSSDSSIRTLSTEVVHLIAAGEVIDSLAAVVRELVENALDAGATRIAIAVWPGQWRVRVADNGCGMGLDDLRRAALPHTTSKICDRDDLWKISSLGFRGEALHSLAQLSELEICSRLSLASERDVLTEQLRQRADPHFPETPLANEGWQIIYNDRGEPLQTQAVAIAAGTIVTAANLFKIWPMRRQGLPSPAQQLRAVQLAIQHMALCYPNVTWQVQRDDRLWFALSPGETAQQILPQILRQLRFSDLQELQLELSTISNEQFAIESGTTGELPNSILPYPCSTPLRYHTPQDSYPSGITSIKTHTPQDSHPTPNISRPHTPQVSHPSGIIPPETRTLHPALCTLYLLLGLPDRCHRRRPDWVKVAVNGRLVRVPELEQAILKGFRRTLPRDRYPICFLHLHLPPEWIDWNRHPAKSEIYLHCLSDWQEQIAQAIEQTLRFSSIHLSETKQSQRLGQLLKTAEAGENYHVSRSTPTAGAEANLETDRIRTLPLKAIAQVHNLYILVEHPAGLWLVEQHIAHERVLYEQLCDRWQLVPLNPPIILNQLSTAQLEQLQRLELTVDLFGEQLWAVRTAPALLAQRDDCSDALLELSLGGDLKAAQVATACRSAIRNGTPLNKPEMQTLIDQWQQTRNPRTCPHGRPIYLSLQETDLARFFRRHWVIGKSHGI